jgi:hypothetical protein
VANDADLPMPGHSTDWASCAADSFGGISVRPRFSAIVFAAAAGGDAI